MTHPQGRSRRPATRSIGRCRAQPSTRVWGSDAIAAMLRELDIPYVALNPGVELSRPARQPGQLSRQYAAAHAALPARGERGGVGAWLRQGDGAPARGDRARQCRADACDDGDLQRLVRPRADDRARRDRGGRCGAAPAVDRVDPHGARPGRADPQLHQMGRPAVFDRGGAGGAAAGQYDRADRTARARLHQFRTWNCRKTRSLPPRRARRPPASRRPRPWSRPARRCARPPNCSPAPSGR